MKLSFQKKWLEKYAWLHYESCGGNNGGWCIPCVLFLSKDEKSALGQFISVYELLQEQGNA